MAFFHCLRATRYLAMRVVAPEQCGGSDGKDPLKLSGSRSLQAIFQ